MCDDCFHKILVGSRELSAEHIAELTRFNESAFGYNIPQRTLCYWGHIFCSREYMGHGRLAGNLVDAVLRGICAASFAHSGQKTFSYLEIGILHGVNFVATYDIVRHLYQETSFSAIDPFNGYYGKNTDIVLGIPVIEDILQTNLRLCAIPSQDIAIYKGNSLDTKIQKAHRDKIYDMIFIDGDHSYAGLQGDCEYYGNLLKPQGILIIDDYHDAYWPEVTQYIDAELLDNANYVNLGCLARSIVFRKR